MLLVAAATAAWAAGAVFDGVVVALDRPWWATAHVAALVAGRIALIAARGAVAAPAVAATGGGGGWLAAAWLAPVLLWALPGAVAVAVLARAARPPASRPPPRRRCSARWPWRGSGRRCCTRWRRSRSCWVWGPGPGMVFFVAWQVVTAVDLAAVWVLGRAGGTGRRRLLLTRRAGAAVVAACAGPLLGVFGPDYAAAADVLRVLLLGAAFRLVVVHELGALEAAGRAWSSARLHLYTTVPTLLAVARDLRGRRRCDWARPAMPSAAAGTVLLPVAAGYALVQVACCVAVLVPFPTWSRTRPEEQP